MGAERTSLYDGEHLQQFSTSHIEGDEIVDEGEYFVKILVLDWFKVSLCPQSSCVDDVIDDDEI
jgi:hypothetical protein